MRITSVVLALSALLASSAHAPQTAATAVAEHGWKAAPPVELFAVERVIDGDTIYIQRGGQVDKLRLLSVDTEEKAATQLGDPTKPSTAFGEDCAQWAVQFFAQLAEPGQPAKIGVLFPGGHEDRDSYGRLLCHVILPDGRNYNLLLVELGKSPYFNKYGNDSLCHGAFLAAQRAAREKELGIWNPKTNEAKTPGAPSAKRPYDRLVPWWDARAAAVDGYRERVAQDPAHVANAELPRELERALETSLKGEKVEVFGLIEKLFDEKDGSLTVLMRSGVKDGAVRAKIDARDRERFAALDLAHRGDDFRQNYVWVQGLLERGPRGFDLRCADPTALRTAGPEPQPAPEPRGN